MNMQAATVLKTIEGRVMPLRAVRAQGRLHGLLFELEITQDWENTETTNIEAEYTFPVPHRAVLLGLELEIGERRLQAVATPRQRARHAYESAIDEGDSAALLERAGDGLYTLSLGNLMPGERAAIRYRYAELLDRSADEVRLSVPTVIAPRFGDPAAHGLQPHQAPQVDLSVAYPFEISIDIVGAMAGATITSPSHSILRQDAADGCRIALAREAALDRDFILTLAGPVTRSASTVAPDGDGHVALVSLDPGLTESPPEALSLKVLVDCSGSMAGDSIAAARRALAACTRRLEPRDHISLSRFGSRVQHVTQGMVPATEVARAGITRYLDDLQADLGGTALPEALAETIAIAAPDARSRADILLITDAEVWAVEQIVETAARSRHRLFVVAVGAAPAEALSRRLAETTGGACEFVAPGEDAEAAIVRMFRRLRETPKRVISVHWPVKPLWQAPLPTAVFSGDTLHLLAGFDTCPSGELEVLVGTESAAQEKLVRLAGTLAAPAEHDVLPRVAAARRLSALEEEEATALAERYQLASRFTSLVVVQVRDAEGKASDLPAVRTVAQMLAAGWGGSSAVLADLALAEPAMKRRSGCVAAASTRVYSSRRSACPDASDFEFVDPHESAPAGAVMPPEWTRRFLENLTAARAAGDDGPRDWPALEKLGVAAEVVGSLESLASREGLPPEDVINLFISMLADTDAGDDLDGALRRALVGAASLSRQNREARSRIRFLLQSLGCRESSASATLS